MIDSIKQKLYSRNINSMKIMQHGKKKTQEKESQSTYIVSICTAEYIIDGHNKLLIMELCPMLLKR